MKITYKTDRLHKTLSFNSNVHVSNIISETNKALSLNNQVGWLFGGGGLNLLMK